MRMISRMMDHRRAILLAGVAGTVLIPASAGAQGDPSGMAMAEAVLDAPLNFAWTLIAGFLVFFMQDDVIQVQLAQRNDASAGLGEQGQDVDVAPVDISCGRYRVVLLEGGMGSILALTSRFSKRRQACPTTSASKPSVSRQA